MSETSADGVTSSGHESGLPECDRPAQQPCGVSGAGEGLVRPGAGSSLGFRATIETTRPGLIGMADASPAAERRRVPDSYARSGFDPANRDITVVARRAPILSPPTHSRRRRDAVNTHRVGCSPEPTAPSSGALLSQHALRRDQLVAPPVGGSQGAVRRPTATPVGLLVFWGGLSA